MSKSEIDRDAAPKATKGKQSGPISLYPLTPDQALSAFLRVKPADLKRLEEQEAAKKKAAKGKGRKK